MSRLFRALIDRRDGAGDARGHAGDDGERWHIPGHHGSHAHKRKLSDGYSVANDRAGRDMGAGFNAAVAHDDTGLAKIDLIGNHHIVRDDGAGPQEAVGADR
jgi:hypothetical protein